MKKVVFGVVVCITSLLLIAATVAAWEFRSMAIEYAVALSEAEVILGKETARLEGQLSRLTQEQNDLTHELQEAREQVYYLTERFITEPRRQAFEDRFSTGGCPAAWSLLGASAKGVVTAHLNHLKGEIGSREDEVRGPSDNSGAHFYFKVWLAGMSGTPVYPVLNWGEIELLEDGRTVEIFPSGTADVPWDCLKAVVSTKG